MTDQMPKPTGLSKPTVGNDDFFNQDFSKFGQPEKNLEVGGGDLAAGLAGSALRGTGTGIAEIGLSDLVRAGAAVSDLSPFTKLTDFVTRKAHGWTEDELASKKQEAVNKITGVTDVVDDNVIKPILNPIGTAIKEGGETLIDRGTSDDYKEALRGRDLFTGDGVSDFAIGDSAGDPAVWAAKFTDGIGSLGGTLAVGALTGGTVKNIVKRQMLKRGASMELADETARLAGIKWGQRGAIAEGVNMSTGQSADQARSQVESLSWDQLLTSKTFNDQVKEISRDPQFEGATATDLLNEARRRTADYAASIAKSDPKTWAAAAAGTLLGDAALFKMLQGTGAKGLAAGALQGMAGEGLGEAVEEGAQQYIGNEATNLAGGQNIDPMSGVVQAAATAGTIGAMSGGGVGAIGGARGARAPAADNSAPIEGDNKSEPIASEYPSFDEALASVRGFESKQPGMHAIGKDGDGFRAAFVDELGNVEVTPTYKRAEDARAAMGFPVSDGGSTSGVGAKDQQNQDSIDTPAFLRNGDMAGRFKGWAEDSDVQRALAGDFGPSVAEMVRQQMDQGEQGPTPSEKPLVDAMNAPLALPNKDIIFAGDANASQSSTQLSEQGAFDDKPAGTGPQFRGAERTRWQDGQEGDVVPAESTGNTAGALPGRVIEGEAREVGTDLPHKPFIAGQDNRAAVSEEQRRQAEQSAMEEQQLNQPKQIGQSGTIFAPGVPGADNKNSAYTPPRLSRDQVDDSLGEQSTRDPRSQVAQSIERAGSEPDSIFGQLKSLRITKRGKPFASQKEAQLASRKTETPIALPEGGFGVVDKAELEQVQASQAAVTQPSGNTGQLDQAEPVPDIVADPAGQDVSQEVTDGMPQQLPAPEAVREDARHDSMPPDDGVAPTSANTAPASDAGVAVSGSGEKRVTIEPLTDKSIIVKGDKNDAELKERVEAAWPKAKPLYNERHKGWVFSSKREGVVREALADLLPGDVSEQKAAPVGEVAPKEPPAAVQKKPAMTNKLRDTGKTLINLGRDKANQPRLSNTPKRASQAASAIRDAENMQADGETLLKIADAVDNGEAPHLSKLSSKAQYQTLDQLHRRAIPNKHMEGGEYRGYYEGRTEKRRKSGVTVDDYADQIQYPTIAVHPDHLRTAARTLSEIRGYKGLADKLNYAARLVTNSDRYRPAELDEETAKALTKAAKDTGNRDVKWAAEHVESGMTVIDRLRRMGIDNRDQLVAAIKELDAIQVPRKQENRLQQLERGLVGNKIPGYFNTQGEALKRVMEAADVKPGETVLEPSAGKGNIADAAKDAGAVVDTVERHNTLREILQEKGHSLVGNDFTTLDASKQYDKVIMNPPFEQQQDIDHVRKAWNHVKPGGRLVAVMSAGVEGNSNRKATEFRQWLDDNGGTMDRLPEGSFKDSDRSAGVNTVMVVMDKPISKEANKPSSTGLRGTPQGVVTKESIARYQADEAQKAADNRRREQEAVGTDYPELNELVAVYSKPSPSVTETRKAAESRVKVSNAIKAAKGLDESYRFDKLIDSNWQSDRDQALALAKEVYAEGDGKASETNVGEISHDVAKLIGRQAGKVILRDGDEAAGRIHIQMRHGDQISAVGFKSVGDFVAHVVGEPTAIYKGNGRGLYLVKEEKPYGLAIVQLEPSDNGDFYDVKTATPMRKDQFKNKEPLYVFAGPSKQSTEVDPLNPKGKSDSSTQSITNGVIDKKTANQRQKETSISDFGEKIGGARKDVWTSYRDSIEGNTAEQIAELPLSKAWPAPDYQKLIDSGVDARAVGLMRAARDVIPSKPRAGYKVKSWASAVKELRDLSMGLLDGSLDPDVVGRMMERSSLRSANNIINKAELYQAVGHQRSLADLTLGAGSYSIFNGVRYNPAKTIWDISRDSKSSAFGNWPRMIATGDTKEQVIAEFKKRYDQLTSEQTKPKAVTFDIYSNDRRASWVVGKKVGRNYIPLSEPFKELSAARSYREENYDALVAELERRKAIPNERRDINNPRVGEDMRSGADVTPEMFSNAFGFRGVEFGNWVEGSRRQRDLNDAYDALMDMAAVLNIHPKAISLNGQLGLAFGARGSGGVSPAAAHYEPGKVVINLTKMNGAGSLGHEWWHALDNYFARMRGDSGSMSDARDVGLAARGSNYFHQGAVRKEMVDAFGAVKRAIDQTAIKARSSKLDGKRSKEYWTTDKEMSARAFESYLISKLQDQGVSNDYLANIASEETWDAMASLGFELDESYPYPTAGEIPSIRAGFDHLFDTIEQKEDGDRVALFSLSDAAPSTRGMTKPELEMVATDWSKQYKGAASARIMVAANQKEMNEVLGMVGSEVPDGQSVNAAYLPGHKTLLLNAEAIQSPKRARELMRHELLAHHGLREVVGDDAYISIIEAVKRGKGINGIKDAYYQVAENYTEMHPDVQAEEVFAHWMEKQPDRGDLAIWWRGIVRRVKDALRAVGLIGERTTEEEFNRVLDAIATGMRNGRQPERRVMESWHEAPAYSKGADGLFTPDRFDAKQFADDVEFASKNPSARHEISMGDTPHVLRRLGLDGIEMVMPASVVRKATDPTVRGHYVPLDVLKSLPSHLSDPVAVMRSRTEQNAFVSLIEATDKNGDPVIVAIHGNAKGESRIEVNKIASVYGKENTNALQSQLDNGLVYVDKTRAAKWLPTVRLQLPEAGAFQSSGSNKSVLTKDDIRNSGALFSLGAATFGDHLSSAERKLNLVPPPDIIDRTKSRIDTLRRADKQQVKTWWSELVHKANTQMLDRLAPIKYAEELIGDIDASESGYVAARLSSGSATTMQATLLYGLPEWKDGVIQKKAGTGEGDALLGIFEGLGKDLHNWLGWMAGHRAEILMHQGRENLLTQDEINALKALDKGKEQQFKEAKAKWNALNSAVLDLGQEAGLFTAADRANWENEWYIPFFRDSEDGDVAAPFKTNGIANQSAGIKKLKGGTANVNDLLENIFTTTGKMIDASMKNMAAQKVVWNLADTDIIDVIPKPNLMDMRSASKPGNQMLWVKIEGEDHLIRVNDPDLFRAMTMIDQKRERGPVMRMAMKAKQLLTSGVTASPEFMLRNFLRDAVSAWGINEDGFKPLIDSIRGVQKTLKMNGGSIDMMFSGASFLGGHVNGNNPEGMAHSVRKALRAKGMSPEQIDRYEKSLIKSGKQALDVLGSVWHKYERIGEAIENGSREAVYEAAIKAGKSHAQAAFEAKDLMDFSMLGSSKVMQFLVDVLPFFNARMQGLGKLGRAVRNNPRQMLMRGGMIAGASLALLAINWDDDRYDDLPDWDKDLNWHFWFGDQHFRIPKPFEIGLIFGTLPERMTRAMGGKDTAGKFGQVVARNMLETFAINPIPQVVKPITEAYFNYDPFRGGPIDNMSDLNVLPEARYDDRTSLLMRELGELTGFSPKKLQHIVEGYTGTIGAYVIGAGDMLVRGLGDYGESPDMRADQIPLLRTLYQGSEPARSSQAMSNYYEMLGQVSELNATINQYKKEGRFDEARELLRDNREALAKRPALTASQRQFRALRNEMELINRSRILTAEQKRVRIDKLLERRNNLASKLVKQFGEN